MSQLPTKEHIREAIEGAGRGDLDGFMVMLHPDVEVDEPSYLPYGGHYQGVAEIGTAFAGASQVVDFATIQIHAITADEDRVVMLESVKLVATGEEVTFSEHWRFEDGLIRHIQVFWFSLPPQ
jgi:ketosteroid isomerase-like protein